MTSSTTHYTTDGKVVTHTHDDGTETVNTVGNDGRIRDSEDVAPDGTRTKNRVERDVFGPTVKHGGSS